jgi:hypothetical protein
MKAAIPIPARRPATARERRVRQIEVRASRTSATSSDVPIIEVHVTPATPSRR